MTLPFHLVSEMFFTCSFCSSIYNSYTFDALLLRPLIIFVSIDAYHRLTCTFCSDSGCLRVNLEFIFEPIINQLRPTIEGQFPRQVPAMVCVQSRQGDATLTPTACAARFCCHLSQTLQRVISDLYRGIKRVSVFKRSPLWRAAKWEGLNLDSRLSAFVIHSALCFNRSRRWNWRCLSALQPTWDLRGDPFHFSNFSYFSPACEIESAFLMWCWIKAIFQI